jgi:hypothetical protein
VAARFCAAGHAANTPDLRTRQEFDPFSLDHVRQKSLGVMTDVCQAIRHGAAAFAPDGGGTGRL